MKMELLIIQQPQGFNQVQEWLLEDLDMVLLDIDINLFKNFLKNLFIFIIFAIMFYFFAIYFAFDISSLAILLLYSMISFILNFGHFLKLYFFMILDYSLVNPKYY